MDLVVAGSIPVTHPKIRPAARRSCGGLLLFHGSSWSAVDSWLTRDFQGSSFVRGSWAPGIPARWDGIGSPCPLDRTGPATPDEARPDPPPRSGRSGSQPSPHDGAGEAAASPAWPRGRAPPPAGRSGPSARGAGAVLSRGLVSASSATCRQVELSGDPVADAPGGAASHGTGGTHARGFPRGGLQPGLRSRRSRRRCRA